MAKPSLVLEKYIRSYMKKIFICLLTCLLLTQIYVIDTFADSSTIYESDDFEIDRIYHFKAGDSIKFSDGDIFDISIIDENRKTVVSDIYEYVFESDLSSRWHSFSCNLTKGAI